MTDHAEEGAVVVFPDAAEPPVSGPYPAPVSAQEACDHIAFLLLIEHGFRQVIMQGYHRISAINVTLTAFSVSCKILVGCRLWGYRSLAIFHPPLTIQLSKQLIDCTCKMSIYQV